MKRDKDSKQAAKAKARKRQKVALLAGGNPQIAKAEGDAPGQAYIAAMPGWKKEIGKRLDALIVRSVPNVRKAGKWNSPFYGIEGQSWFLSFHVFTRYVKVATSSTRRRWRAGLSRPPRCPAFSRLDPDCFQAGVSSKSQDALHTASYLKAARWNGNGKTCRTRPCSIIASGNQRENHRKESFMSVPAQKASVEAQPLIAVRNVRASSRWYAELLGADSLPEHSHRDLYERISHSGQLILQLHAWDEDQRRCCASRTRCLAVVPGRRL